MPTLTNVNQTRPFTAAEIFKVPDLTIYEQMVCIVLSSFVQDAASLPSIPDMAAKGRMSAQEATNALQALVEKKVIPHHVFREIVGDYGDNRLSWAAKGLWVYLKNNQSQTLSELAALSSDDSAVLMKELGELKRLGYLDDHSLLREIG